MKKLVYSFVYAFRGIGHCLRRERNFRLHLTIALYVCLLAPYFALSRGEWAALILVFGLVPAAEAFNTAVERLVDLTSPQPHPLARAAKDVAAGAVLLCALTAVGVAVCLLTDPEGWQRMLADFEAHIWKPIALCASIPVAGWIVFRSYSTKND